MELNLIRVTGPIDDQTPLCVIEELALALGLAVDNKKMSSSAYVEAVIKHIRETPGKRLPVPNPQHPTRGYDQNQWTLITGFINADPGIQWKIGPLIRAFDHLYIYYESKEPPLPESEFQVGPITPTYPISYNASILYRICVYHGIRTSRQSNIASMSQAVSYLREESATLRERIISQIESLHRVSLINLLLSVDMKVAPSPNLRQLPKKVSGKETSISQLPSFNPERLDRKVVDRTYAELTKLSNLFPRVTPLTHEEAIILGAVTYSLNLSECCNPHGEYLEISRLTSRAQVGGNYAPLYDRRFQERYRLNPQWFDVRKNWAPRLTCIYSPQDLTHFALSEGYSQEEVTRMGAENCLQESRVTPTFYLGCHPDIPGGVLRSGIRHEEIKDHQQALILSYGISADLGGSSMNIYLVSELAEWFRRSKSYGDPVDAKKSFSPLALRKLLLISRNFTEDKSRVTEISRDYQDLIEAITTVEDYTRVTSEQAKRLSTLYNSDSKAQVHLDALFEKTLHACYYMRGWRCRGGSESDPPPIKTAATNFDRKNHEGQVYMNVSRAIGELEETLAGLPPSLQTIWKDLFLMKFQHSGDGGSRFQAIVEPDQGLTIMGRIGIVKNGKGVYSCIRLSSNVLLASLYYYMIGCGKEAPFPIRQLGEIS